MRMSLRSNAKRSTRTESMGGSKCEMSQTFCSCLVADRHGASAVMSSANAEEQNCQRSGRRGHSERVDEYLGIP